MNSINFNGVEYRSPCIYCRDDSIVMYSEYDVRCGKCDNPVLSVGEQPKPQGFVQRILSKLFNL